MDLQGLVYLLNQSGVALMEAEERIGILSEQIKALTQENSDLKEASGIKKTK